MRKVMGICIALFIVTVSFNPAWGIEGKGIAATADLIFTAPDDAIVALGSDKKENVHVITEGGAIFSIAAHRKPRKIYSGLRKCPFSLTSSAVLPDGSLVVNDCVDDKDVLIKVNQNGNKTTLMKLEESLVSMASDTSGQIYLGVWLSEGNLTVVSNPSHLTSADSIRGQVLSVGKDNTLTNLYEGGLPFAVAASKGGLYVSLWGRKGPLNPGNKSYSVSDPRHIFWICLSDTVEIRRLQSNQNNRMLTDKLDAVSSIAAGKDNVIFAYGITKDGKRGIYMIKGERPPQRLLFTKEGMDKGITGLAFSGNNLFFSTVGGKVYRVGVNNRMN
ncbi:MAG TPA: hypothetical protein VF790_06290 [Dissulfurispiraceae bacterium]